MKLFSKYCPSYSRISVWLWNSPTFTTWGNYAVQSLRLVLVTPLILTRFDETEIAVWYLFATLNFFGVILSQRLGQPYTQMFAFAMGGAFDLSPIKNKEWRGARGNEPNWGAFKRAYGTIGLLSSGVAILNLLSALALGIYGITNLLNGYEGVKAGIWIAFGVLQFGQFMTYIFQRYILALIGMNYVALINRWGIIFSLLSIFIGCVALLFGAGIATLAIAMQLSVVLGILRNRFLLQSVEGGRVLKFPAYSFDREVFSWAWEPSYRGFLIGMANLGSRSLIMIMVTSLPNKGIVASFLFTMRLLDTINRFSLAPLTSRTPKLARLWAQGNLSEMRREFERAFCIVVVVFLFGVWGLMYFGNPLLSLINAEAMVLGRQYLLPYLAFGLFFRLSSLFLQAAQSANNILLARDEVLAALCGLSIVFYYIEAWGIWAILAGLTIPRFMMINFRAIFQVSYLLGLPNAQRYLTFTLVPLSLYTILGLLV